MRVRLNKRKGTTLIEVLISITIFSIVSIPLSMMVIGSVGNNKKGENNQTAVATAQQIIEQLKANNMTTPGSITIKTDTTHVLTFGPNPAGLGTGHDIGYLASYTNVGNGLEANVTFERKLAYSAPSQTSTGVNYDFSITMDKVTGTVNTTTFYGSVNATLTNDLKIYNTGDLDHTIQLKDNKTNDVLATYTPPNGAVNNIEINYKPDYGPHEIYFENDATNDLAVYIFTQGNQNANTYTNVNGSIKFYDNLSRTQTVAGAAPVTTNGIYDISVDIYKGQGSNKVKVYSTKTSISLDS